jgi:ABC-2 type transport system ATP-binding protein
MPIVELQEVRKAYDTKIAVDNVSFTIEPGTMFGLLGPNGSGKTSSIRMMIGITVPDSGTVNLFGKPFERESLKRVGYLPEERGLYKKMKVMDQLIFLGQLHGLDATIASKRAHQWCERMQITEAIPKKTEELSKGMQQKIQFIAALLHDPDLIIMDEPFSGLDPVNATLLQDTLIELRNGRVVLAGAMREVKSRYPVNRIHITYTGDESFLRHPAVASAKHYNGYAEIVLRATPQSVNQDMAAEAQAILTEAVSHGTRISKFELMEPTLEEIFIEKVGTNHADFDTGSSQLRIPIELTQDQGGPVNA